MAEILSGKAVAEAMSGKIKADVSALNNKGIIPTLAIIRVERMKAICLMSAVQ